MKTIWKYILKSEDEQIIEMPRGAEILTVQLQNHALCLWAIVYEHVPKTPRKIIIYFTGEEITKDKNNLKYIGTCQLSDGKIIVHVFEEV